MRSKNAMTKKMPTPPSLGTYSVCPYVESALAGLIGSTLLLNTSGLVVLMNVPIY